MTLYASQIEISNFRSFGPNFSLAIPPEAGLVIIYGMNGLGKTTFFEALEWLLTEDVRRISDNLRAGQLDKHLTRHGAAENSHRVSVDFNEPNSRIVRSSSGGPTGKDLSSTLCRSDWRPAPTDTTPYFRLTMFLPQSKRYRFDEEDPGDQWKLLEGPAGVDRLEQMRTALGSQRTQNAFKRRMAEAERVLSSCEEKLAEWNKLIEAREEYRGRPAFGNAVDPARATTDLKDMEENFRNVGVTAELVPVTEANVTTFLANALQNLHDARYTATHRLQRLKTAGGPLVDSWKIKSSRHSDIKKDLADAVQNESDTTKKKEALQRELDRADEEAVQARTELDRSASLIKRLHHGSTVWKRIEDSGRVITELEAELGVLSVRMKDVESALEKKKSQESEHAELSQRIENVVSRITSLADLRKRWSHYKESQDDSLETEAALERLSAAKADLETLQKEVDGKIRDAQSRESRLESEKDSALKNANEVSKSVSAICKHITENVLSCPVCQAKYKEGELLDLAKAALGDTDTEVAELVAELARTKESIQDLETQKRDVDERIRGMSSEFETKRREVDDRKTSWKDIETTLSELGMTSQPDEAELDKSQESLQQSLVELRAELEALPARRDLDEELQTLETSRVSVADELKDKNDRLRELKQASDSDQAIMRSIEFPASESKEHQGLATRMDEFNRALPELVSDNAQMSAEVNDLESARDKKRNEWETAENLEKELQKKIINQKSEEKAIGDELVAMSERWTGLTLTGEPDSSTLLKALNGVEDEIERIDDLRKKCQRISEGLDAYREDTEVRVLEEEIGQFVKETEKQNETDVKEELSSRVEAKQKELQKIREVMEKTQQLADDLKKKADKFNDSALKPLTSRIQEFHDVLSPFRYQINWSARTGKSGTKLKQTVRPSSGRDSDREVPPLAELSDGQVSVQGLSTLFAASTEYRWSRWPALFLDDPLQSSDLLHASAFIDIIRGLIVDEGYQIYVSSHDLEEAKYIIRKCERSRITVTQCHLLGPGVNGVRWSVL